jgi:hypothetical protein
MLIEQEYNWKEYFDLYGDSQQEERRYQAFKARFVQESIEQYQKQANLARSSLPKSGQAIDVV